MADTIYDCQTCGACCVHLSPYDGNAYVYLDRQEVSRMRGMGLRVVGGRHLPTSAKWSA